MNQRETLDNINYPIVFSLMFVLDLVNGRHDVSRSVCHVQCVNLLCINTIDFPNLFDLIGLSFTTQLN